MRIIKDNSDKEIKIKCECCKTKYAVKVKEFDRWENWRLDCDCFSTCCPVCRNVVNFKKLGGFFNRKV